MLHFASPCKEMRREADISTQQSRYSGHLEMPIFSTFEYICGTALSGPNLHKGGGFVAKQGHCLLGLGRPWKCVRVLHADNVRHPSGAFNSSCIRSL